MNNAIIFIKKPEFALMTVLGKTLIEYTCDRLKKANLNVYVLGADKAIEKRLADKANCISNAKTCFEEIAEEAGKTIFTGISFPNMTCYEELLKVEGAKAVTVNGSRSDLFVLDNRDVPFYNKMKYTAYPLLDEKIVAIKDTKDLYQFAKALQKEINQYHLENGVIFYDLDQTYIGEDVQIESGVTLYPNVHLEGNTKIKKGTLVTNGSHLINAQVGEDCSILQSRIVDSTLHNRITLGPCSHLRMHCVVEDDVRIGNYVEFKNTRFGRLSRAAHLTYLGDATVGEDVNIGCGVITVNYDGAHKFKTVIKDRAFVGSNANLIAPITVGECSLVAAGSTVSKDVEDGDMAIARSYQTIKPGYGFKYINKEK